MIEILILPYQKWSKIHAGAVFNIPRASKQPKWVVFWRIAFFVDETYSKMPNTFHFPNAWSWDLVQNDPAPFRSHFRMQKQLCVTIFLKTKIGGGRQPPFFIVYIYVICTSFDFALVTKVPCDPSMYIYQQMTPIYIYIYPCLRTCRDPWLAFVCNMWAHMSTFINVVCM